MTDMSNWTKARAAVRWVGGVTDLVWLSDDGLYYKAILEREGASRVDSMCSGNVTPIEKWAPPILDGLWLCKDVCGDVKRVLRVISGCIVDSYDRDVTNDFTLVKYIAPIPNEWGVESDTTEAVR